MTDEARIERLTELAQRVWPHIHVDVDTSATPFSTEGRRLGAWVQQYFPRPVGPVEGGPVLLSIPEHPRALDALEAALLVLAGDDTRLELARLRERARDVIADELDKRTPAWVEQLASEWERRAKWLREKGDVTSRPASLDKRAAELRARAKPK